MAVVASMAGLEPDVAPHAVKPCAPGLPAHPHSFYLRDTKSAVGRKYLERGGYETMPSHWCKTLLIAVFLVWPAMPALSQVRSTTFYVAAHPDDWQLFETPNAIYDTQDSRNKAVFIYVTAGAGGEGTGDPSSTRGVPYFLAREDAAKRSIRFVVGLWGSVPTPTESTAVINGHAIRRYVVGRTVSYFLRLPDGNPRDGTGYATTGRRSLLRLHDGTIASLVAIDGSATYHSWTDLVSTLTALIRSEATGSPTVWVNVHDPDRKTNPESHPDHYQVGMAIEAAIAPMGCINQALYVDYAKAALPRDLPIVDANLQAAIIGTIVSGMIDAGFPSEYGTYRHWLGRNYFRVIRGTGACRWPPQH